VIGIHALDLVWGLGTLHCLSQQEPAASWPAGTGLPGPRARPPRQRRRRLPSSVKKDWSRA